MAQAIPIIALAVTAASAGYQVYSANEQADKAYEANQKAQKSQEALLQEQQQQTQVVEDQISNQSSTDALLKNRNSARNRQKALAAGAQGPLDTILTSPLGLTNQPQTAGKTLLGL